MEKECKWQEPKYILSLVLIVGVIALGVLSILRDRIVNPNMNQMSVSAEGEVFAKPDIATISFGVQTERFNEAVGATKAGTEKMNAVMAKLAELEVEDKDVKTTQYNLNPVYSYGREDGIRNLIGYELYQAATVKIRDLEKIGEIVEAVSSVGANQIGNVSFTIDDQDELQAEARVDAIAKAKEKAQAIADAAGISLGDIVNIYESSNPQPMYRNDFAYAESVSAGIGGGGGPIPDIASGEMEVTVNVTLVYKIK
ncbi:MAG: SIMPL domain-containing protein [Candidatus Komeilibacteria bacterium]